MVLKMVFGWSEERLPVPHSQKSSCRAAFTADIQEPTRQKYIWNEAPHRFNFQRSNCWSNMWLELWHLETQLLYCHLLLIPQPQVLWTPLLPINKLNLKKSLNTTWELHFSVLCLFFTANLYFILTAVIVTNQDWLFNFDCQLSQVFLIP